MYRILLLSIILLNCFHIQARQEYIDNGDEKGYAKDGLKIGYWEYYDSNELQIKINHDNGKLVFLALDSSEYVVNVDGQWIERSFRIYPFRVGSRTSYYRHLGVNVDYPAKARNKQLTGVVFITFEIDIHGLPINFNIIDDLCEGCNQANLKALNDALGVWIPAQVGGVKYASRFVQPIIYKLGQYTPDPDSPRFPDIMEFEGENYKSLDAVVVVGYTQTSVSSFGTVGSLKTVQEKKNGLSPTSDHGFNRYLTIEDALDNHANVKYLDLTDHYYRSLSERLSELTNLEILNLADNDIDKLSLDLFKLNKLSELFLDRNKLSDLPSDMSKLTKLTRLSLSGNYFSEFPKVVTQLINLKELDLTACGITTIPEDIDSLQQLQKLNISGNNITKLPDSFYRLSDLKELRIDLNKLDKEERKKLKNELASVKISK